MSKTILITGATDGIGFETAKELVSLGHHVLLHGRNEDKLKAIEQDLSQVGKVESFIADLSLLEDVDALAKAVIEKHNRIDVLINNAGVLKAPHAITEIGLDIRFVVNTIAPYLLTKKLLPLLGNEGRVINLSSAAQAPIDIKAMINGDHMNDMSAYAQSKLAITMWTHSMAKSHPNGPIFIAVNPGSLLGSKMVKEGFGIAGGDLTVGSDILVQAALDDEFLTKTGQYFDNDKKDFSTPHPDVLDERKCEDVIQAIDSIISN